MKAGHGPSPGGRKWGGRPSSPRTSSARRSSVATGAGNRSPTLAAATSAKLTPAWYQRRRLTAGCFKISEAPPPTWPGSTRKRTHSNRARKVKVTWTPMMPSRSAAPASLSTAEGNLQHSSRLLMETPQEPRVSRSSKAKGKRKAETKKARVKRRAVPERMRSERGVEEVTHGAGYYARNGSPDSAGSQAGEAVALPTNAAHKMNNPGSMARATGNLSAGNGHCFGCASGVVPVTVTQFAELARSMVSATAALNADSRPDWRGRPAAPDSGSLLISAAVSHS